MRCAVAESVPARDRRTHTLKWRPYLFLLPLFRIPRLSNEYTIEKINRQIRFLNILVYRYTYMIVNFKVIFVGKIKPQNG